MRQKLWDPRLGTPGAWRAGLVFAILFGFLISFVLLPAKAWPEDPFPCDHDWVQGPFYVKACWGFECPTYYPPAALIPVEHCTKCGLLRLPPGLWQEEGDTILPDHSQQLIRERFDAASGATCPVSSPEK